ncbi:MAG: hypothetical protein Q8N81_01955, partial [bacterium]|nr:hypothetical protein [bacterium]
KLLFIFAFLAGFFYFLWGAFQWITSAGDKGGLQGAKDKISAAIIGLLLIAFAFVIIRVVEQFLGLAIITGGVKWPSPPK